MMNKKKLYKKNKKLFPPISCYQTHGKRLAQRGEFKILRRCSVSPSPQLCRCPPERCRAPRHGRRQHSNGAFPLHGTVRFGTARYGTVRLSSGRFAFPPQYSPAIEWAGLFTRRYNCAASTAVTSS